MVLSGANNARFHGTFVGDIASHYCWRWCAWFLSRADIMRGHLAALP